MRDKKYTYNPEIYIEHKSRNRITILLKSGSICELDSASFLIRSTLSDLNVMLKEPVFQFSRLKSKIEGRGDGAFLMNRLIDILDLDDITVINQPNPYGKMNMTALISFYIKYGFVNFGDDIFIRFPRDRMVNG